MPQIEIVDIAGGRYRDFGETPMRISVCLVEDGVKPRNQKGADDDFLHNHVVRDYNSAWGDPIVWDAYDSFACSYDFGLKKNYNPANLHIVAYINEYDAESQTKCRVDNCAKAPITGFAGIGAIEGPTDDPVVDTIWYDINALRVSPDAEGLKIRITKHLSGKTTQYKHFN